MEAHEHGILDGLGLELVVGERVLRALRVDVGVDRDLHGVAALHALHPAVSVRRSRKEGCGRTTPWLGAKDIMVPVPRLEVMPVMGTDTAWASLRNLSRALSLGRSRAYQLSARGK